MIVIDASVAAPIILPDEAETLSAAAVERLMDDVLLVPMHWHVEVASIVRKAIRRGRLTEVQGGNALSRAARLEPLVDDQTARQAWTASSVLAHRHDLTVYDSAYLELALRTASPLATLDGKLAAAARREQVTIVTMAA